MTSRLAPIAFVLCVVPFVVLATLNASDQAFYRPAVLMELDPGLFPRGARVLAAQTTLTAVQ